MRYMMLIKDNNGSGAGALPSKALVAAMGKFNEEMAKAGVPFSATGLIEWSSRFHFGGSEVVEVRQVFEVSDFSPQDAARKQRLAC